MDQAYFGTILITVVGQAFNAAGYALDDLPLKQAGGQYRFTRTLDSGLRATIEFQALLYTDTEWSSGQPSRFRVTLARSDGQRRDLSALVVQDFGVKILPSAAHWWTFRTVDDLGKALAEAGHLAVGYGMPWLAGDLTPPAADRPITAG
jgi:hypothetical protein